MKRIRTLPIVELKAYQDVNETRAAGLVTSVPVERTDCGWWRALRSRRGARARSAGWRLPADAGRGSQSAA